MRIRFKILFLAALAALSACQAAAADTRKKLVLLIAEPEYDTHTTLPEFAAKQLAKDFRVVTVAGSNTAAFTQFDAINEIADADVLLVSVRRRTPPKAQLDAIRRHIQAGKAVVGIRTASHAFALGRGQTLAEGNAEWAQFDAEVIGGSYSNHHGKGPPTHVTLAEPAAANHPILKGVTVPFDSESTLYKNTPLRAGAKALLIGTIPGQQPEPLAWTFTRPGGGRTFYTSLGSPSDFKNTSFVTLLRNGIIWAAQ
jgi:type 1 glutamine amidotransferase